MLNDLTEIAKTGLIGVIILMIGLVFWLVKEFLTFIRSREDAHTSCYNDLKKSIEANTKVTQETYRYLKLRNGHLEKILKDKKGE